MSYLSKLATSTYETKAESAIFIETFAPYLITDQLPTVPNCRIYGSSSVSNGIFTTSANVGVIPVMVLPESHRVQRLAL